MPGVYKSKPNPGFKSLGHRCWLEEWGPRMASRYTIVEVRCSTEPQPEDEPLYVYKRHQPEDQAWKEVLLHMVALDELNALQPGVWTLTIPGTDIKHSFEVE